MTFTETELEGVLVLGPRVWEDRRGFFFESYSQRTFSDHGLAIDFVQDNHSMSRRNTVRGLHYQQPPHAQDKLVRVVAGEVLDVVVDLRRGSPTFGKSLSINLSSNNRKMLFVPKGFAHGFCTLSNTAEMLYKCSSLYAAGAARGLRWNDPALDIVWPVSEPILSEQDQTHPHLAQLGPAFDYEQLRQARGDAP